MNIDEIHIKVRQDIQKIDSHANGNLLDEEIDFHLNYFIRKFVDNVVGKLKGLPTNPTDFQISQRLLDSISTLQVRNYSINAYVNEDNVASCVLPYNYRHLIEDKSEISYNCRGISKTKVDSRVYMHPLTFLADFNTFKDLELKKNGVTFFRLSDHLPNGIAYAESKYQVIKLVLDNTTLYWEHYNGEYYPNTFIHADIVASNITYLVKDFNNVVTTITSTKQTIINKIYRYDTKDTFIKRPNRLTKDNNLNYVLNHPFEKSTWEYPVSTLGNGKLYVYEDNEFRVKNVIIDYIREPIETSKIRAVNVDLPDSSVQLIVEQTIVHLKGMIQDPTWQISMQQNNLNNQ